VIAGAVAAVIRGELSAPQEFLEGLAGLAARYDAGFGEHLRELAGWISLPPSRALSRIEAAGLPPFYRDAWSGSISPFVIPGVLWSLYAFLNSPGDYLEAICLAIWPGGDVDTTAAMTGAISGAHLGERALPSALVARLNDRGAFGADELRALADRVLVIKRGGSG
jgi:hypothetical protein